VAFDRGFLHRGRSLRHDDVRRDAPHPCGERKCLRVVAAGMRHNTASGLGIREPEHGIGRTAILERPDLLQVLALEVESAPGALVERRTRHHRRAMNDSLDALRGLAHGGKITGIGWHGVFTAVRNTATLPAPSPADDYPRPPGAPTYRARSPS